MITSTFSGIRDDYRKNKTIETHDKLSNIPILLFVNPISGGGLANEIIKKIKDEPNVFIVYLPENENNWFDKFETQLEDPNLRVCVAGGDGTVNWVISLLKDYYDISDDDDKNNNRKPPLAIIPFGTGNDASRSLGWGNGMSSSTIDDIPNRIQLMRKTENIEDIDIWNVNIWRNSPKDSRDSKGNIITKNRQMINYFSIGLDAAIVHKYEELRMKEKPSSQLASMALYIPAGATFLIDDGEDLSDYCMITAFGINDDDDSKGKTIVPIKGEKNAVFQSSITMYGGRVDWAGNSKPSMNDKKIEFRLLQGITQLAMCQVGLKHARPAGQVKKVRIETMKQCYYQIDGEASKLDTPAVFNLTHSFKYPVLIPQTKLA